MDPKKCPHFHHETGEQCYAPNMHRCPCAAHPDFAQTMKDAALGRNVRAMQNHSGHFLGHTLWGWMIDEGSPASPSGDTPEDALKSAGLWKE